MRLPLLFGLALALSLPARPAQALRTVEYIKDYTCEVNGEYLPGSPAPKFLKVVCRLDSAPESVWHVCFSENQGPRTRRNCVDSDGFVFTNDESGIYQGGDPAYTRWFVDTAGRTCYRFRVGTLSKWACLELGAESSTTWIPPLYACFGEHDERTGVNHRNCFTRDGQHTYAQVATLP